MGVFKKQGNWWIDFYHQGKRIRRKVGPSKKMAELKLADVQVKKAKNDFLGVCEPKKILFKDFAAEYLEYSKANKAKRSYERDVLTLDGHVTPLWGDQHLCHLNPKMIEEYKARRLEKVTASTVNRELDTIKNMLRKAVEWGYLKTSPAEHVKKLRTGKPHFRYLAADEIEKLLGACGRSDNPQLYSFVAVALNTGMRLGELTALEWKDIDFKRGSVRVDNKKDHHTKNYEVRTIPMNDTLADVLRRIPRRLDSSYVFQRKDGEKFRKMRTGFGNAVKRAGIPHVRFHDLRHTFASHLVMGGVDIRAVQELMGHKDIRMTMRYSHLAPDHMKNAVRILDSHYLDTKGSERENQDAACQA
ncbi:MAG: tyrosine-type recombinase/integrase [Thermodesulfobacteriota bacterium]